MSFKAFLKFVFFCFTAVVLTRCKDEKPTKSKDKVVVSFKKEGTLQLKKAESDSIIITLDIEIADNDYETETGLMYRTELATHQAMLFVLKEEKYQNFYMKNTRIPLDIIYIDSEKSIVSFQKNTKPFDETSLPSEAPAKYVLEINEGLSDEWELEVGDKIVFEVIK
ncbi:DUF192 domain-containing protein [uncultured Winogradskyella sp.]|uniref:DUF192 domain-containing protein n=1 Tax=uncultured Winogradskyella sp. TaxID=395353 RepID=UPI00263921DE|nr:DUF192 domain-containing protein [uncultured Winogradskyella sp.]